MNQIKPGIYPDMDFADYLKIDALNKSGMKDFKKSPHCYRVMREISAPTPAMLEGTLLHWAILEPHKLETMTRYHKYKTCKEVNGIIYLDTEKEKEIKKMAAIVREHPIAKDLLSAGKSETSIFWEDPEFGFLCKARLDWICEKVNIIVDIKKTKDASIEEFNYQAYKLRYHWQAYWNKLGMRILTGNPYSFIFLSIEGDPIYDVTLRPVPQKLLNQAGESVDKIRYLYHTCIKNNEWPGYPQNFCDLEFASYQKE